MLYKLEKQNLEIKAIKMKLLKLHLNLNPVLKAGGGAI
jgi:hypothetical protein